jgi:hypothetical protein
VSYIKEVASRLSKACKKFFKINRLAALFLKTMKKTNKKNASALVFSLIILFIMTTVALGIASITIISMKLSSTTGKSSEAFQIADSGAEVTLKTIKGFRGDSAKTIDDLGSCNSSSGFAKISGNIGSIDKSYIVSFYEKGHNDPTPGCGKKLADLKKIKVVGTYAGTVRAVEVSVLVKQVPYDFNADGKADILWRNISTGANSVWYMNGATIASSAYLDPVADLNWKAVGSDDFNGDGKDDILWRNNSTDQDKVWYMDGISHTDSADLGGATVSNFIIAGTGDFNGDNKPDILWRNTVSGENYIWYMNGTSHYSNVPLETVADLNWKIAGVGDFNYDNKPDIVWRNTSTGQNAVWYMNGANGATHAGSDQLGNYVTDLDWHIVGVGDFNYDNKPDILWRNTGTGADSGKNAVWYMNGATIIGSVYLDPVADLNWKIAGGESNY